MNKVIMHRIIVNDSKFYYSCNQAVRVKPEKSNFWTHKKVTCKNCLR